VYTIAVLSKVERQLDGDLQRAAETAGTQRLILVERRPSSPG